MGQNTNMAIEFGLTAVISYYYDIAMFSVENVIDYLHDKGIPSSHLYVIFGIVIGIGITVLVTTANSFLKKRQGSNRKYLGIGKIRYDKTNKIGSGSTGSVVYHGKYETMDAAIKVIKLGSSKKFEKFKKEFSLKDPMELRERGSDHSKNLADRRIRREISINQAITLHNDFIVQYHGQEVFKLNKNTYLLIALELCKSNLQDVLDFWNDFRPLKTKSILRNLGEGLFFLHESGYVHRDLKPNNILIKKFQHPAVWRVKLADFGASKSANFIQGRGHYSVSGDYGSGGWIAPEADTCVTEKKGDSSSDIFSMGLIFYFVVTRGNKLYESQENIIDNNPSDITKTMKKFPLEMDLINKMTNRDKTQRPTAAEIRKHPALWDSQTILNFTAAVNEFLKLNEPAELERGHRCFPGRWNSNLTPNVEQALIRRSYNFTTVKELIRGIRNYGAHYARQPKSVKREFGSYPEEYIEYWLQKFPNLLLHTYNVFNFKPPQRKDESLKKFY